MCVVFFLDKKKIKLEFCSFYHSDIWHEDTLRACFEKLFDIYGDYL